MPASTQCVRTLTGRCSGRSDPQLRAGQRTMPRVLPNERLLPTPFKPVSTNLHVRHRQLAPPDRDSLPTLPIYHHGCMVLGHLSRPTGRRWPPSPPSVRTKKVHPTLAPNNLQAAPLAKGGVPRLRSVHADWGCPTTDPPNGVCTLVVAALCSSVCIAVCCCAFDFEFWNLNESADTPS